MVEQEGIRQPGGGGKSAFERIVSLGEGSLGVLEQHTKPSGIDERVRWTHLKGHEITRLLRDKGIEVSVTVVDQLL